MFMNLIEIIHQINEVLDTLHLQNCL